MAKLTLTLSQALGRAISAYNAGKLVEAEQICQQIVSAKSDFFDALHLLAVIQSRLGKKDTALASYDRALTVRPDFAEALYNRGVTLQELKRFEEALASYDRALAVRPDYAEALYNRGVTLQELKRFEEALASYDRALAAAAGLMPRRSTIVAVTLQELKRFEEALASYDRALARAAGLCRGALQSWRHPAGAEAVRGGAGELRPRARRCGRTMPRRSFNRGVTLQELKRFEEALASYDRALGAAAGLCRGALQSWRHPAGAEAVRGGAGELRPRARAAAGLCRGALQSWRHPAGAEAVRGGAGELRPRAHAAAGLCRGALQSWRHPAGAEAVRGGAGEL